MPIQLAKSETDVRNATNHDEVDVRMLTMESHLRAAITESSPPAHERHIPALDGVRGVAILLVLIFHFARFTRIAGDLWLDRLFLHVTQVGWVGVDLFFVLSGFLITGILLDAKGREGYLRTFYARRALRILPLYYAVLCTMVLAALLFNSPVYHRFLETQAWYWLHFQNVLFAQRSWPGPASLGHFWSLAVEEQFYLVWPFAVAFAKPGVLLRLSVGCVIASFLLRLVLSASGAHPAFSYALMPARMDALAIGAVLAILARRDGLVRFLPYAPRVIVGSIIVLAALWVVRGEFNGLHDPLTQVLGFTSLALLFGALLVQIVGNPTGVSSRLFSNGFLRFWGRYSYALYIIHHVVGWHDAAGFAGIHSRDRIRLATARSSAGNADHDSAVTGPLPC